MSERWRKERMYGQRDEVLWAIVTGSTPDDIRVVGSMLKEEDADFVIAAHDAAPQEPVLDECPVCFHLYLPVEGVSK